MDVKLWISFDLALFHFDVKFPFVLTGYGLLLLQLFMMRRLPVLLFLVTQTPWYCDWNRSAVGTACNCSAPAIGIAFSLYFVQLIVEIWNLQLLVLMTRFQSFSVATCLHLTLFHLHSSTRFTTSLGDQLTQWIPNVFLNTALLQCFNPPLIFL